jgi:hypothetical protein
MDRITDPTSTKSINRNPKQENHAATTRFEQSKLTLPQAEAILESCRRLVDYSLRLAGCMSFLKHRLFESFDETDHELMCALDFTSEMAGAIARVTTKLQIALSEECDGEKRDTFPAPPISPERDGQPTERPPSQRT